MQEKHAKITSRQKRVHEFERRCDEFEKRFAGKHEAAAKEKVEETQRQHTTTTKMQREELGGEESSSTRLRRQRTQERWLIATEKELLALNERKRKWTGRRRPK